MRALFTSSNGVNQLHGSDSEGGAKKDFEFFFPMQQTVAVVKPSAINEKGKFYHNLECLLIPTLQLPLFCLLNDSILSVMTISMVFSILCQCDPYCLS